MAINIMIIEAQLLTRLSPWTSVVNFLGASASFKSLTTWNVSVQLITVPKIKAKLQVKKSSEYSRGILIAIAIKVA